MSQAVFERPFLEQACSDHRKSKLLYEDTLSNIEYEIVGDLENVVEQPRRSGGDADGSRVPHGPRRIGSQLPFDEPVPFLLQQTQIIGVKIGSHRSLELVHVEHGNGATLLPSAVCQ